MKDSEHLSPADPANEWMHDPAQVAGVQQMRQDLNWAMEHHSELEQRYAGQSVVVWRQQVIAHGSDEEELLRQAASPGRPREHLVVVEFPAFFESPR